jgi:hypothetical protein
MRGIRYSRTFYEELAELLEQGIDRFGAAVVAQKRDAVFAAIRNYLTPHPGSRQPDPSLGLRRRGARAFHRPRECQPR